MFMCEIGIIIIILIWGTLGSVGTVQQNIKLPSRNRFINSTTHFFNLSHVYHGMEKKQLR